MDAIITDDMGIRHPINLCYTAVDDGKDETTKTIIKDTLKRYGLWSAFCKGKISFAADGGMKSCINLLYEEEGLDPDVQICFVHSSKSFFLVIFNILKMI